MKNYLPYRPILKLPKTKVEKLLDIVALISFLAAILFVLLSWGNIPAEVPAHFNSSGTVDRWGSKYEILILPIIGLFLFVLMSLIEKAPHMHNYPSRINESNVEQFYFHSRKLLNVIKNICLFLFTYLIVQIGRVALGEIHTLGIGFLPIFLLILFGALGIGIYKQTKIK